MSVEGKKERKPKNPTSKRKICGWAHETGNGSGKYLNWLKKKVRQKEKGRKDRVKKKEHWTQKTRTKS